MGFLLVPTIIRYAAKDKSLSTEKYIVMKSYDKNSNVYLLRYRDSMHLCSNSGSDFVQ